MFYLDYHATSPCDQRVVEAMVPFLRELPANPASEVHAAGRQTRRAIEAARNHVAELIGAEPEEIIFTSGATEANNLSLLGTARGFGAQTARRSLLCSAIEHPSVFEPCRALTREGYSLERVPVDSRGRVDSGAFSRSLGGHVLLASVQLANNEIGTVQRLEPLVEWVHEAGALFHCDAAQAVGHVPVDVADLDVDLLSFSGHKLCGPKGIGALFIRGGARAIPLEPLLYGGGQEAGLRSGTLNVPAIVGFGEACRIAREEMAEEFTRVSRLRDRWEARIAESIPGQRINGDQDHRLPGNSSMVLPGRVDAEALIGVLPEVALSTGSACASSERGPSHVLLAIGLQGDALAATLRAGMGRFTTEQEVDGAAELLCAAWKQIRGQETGR